MSKLPKFGMARTFQKNIVKKLQITPDYSIFVLIQNFLSFQMVQTI